MGGHIYPLPPRGYGGVERVAAWWCDELTRRGHYVHIFGHPDSSCAHDRLTPAYAQQHVDGFGPAYAQLGDDLDLIHDNSDSHPSPMRWCRPGGVQRPFVHTVHACVWHRGSPCPVFLSQNQARWFGAENPVIAHNGFPTDAFTVETNKEDFFLWCGSLRTCKAPEMAIQLCEETGERLKIIGPIQDGRYHHFPQSYPRGGQIEYLGEMGAQRMEYFRKAKGFLYTCSQDWMEGMCLVLCEAMLSGTPVIGLVTPNNTIVEEVVQNGLGGYACKDYETMRGAITNGLYRLCSPQECRENGERFSIERTVDRYLQIYQDALGGKVW